MFCLQNKLICLLLLQTLWLTINPIHAADGKKQNLKPQTINIKARYLLLDEKKVSANTMVMSNLLRTPSLLKPTR